MAGHQQGSAPYWCKPWKRARETMAERMASSEHMAAGSREQIARAGYRPGYFLVLLGLPLLATFWLYWPTLSQPYFWDDIVHFLYVIPRSVLRLWANAEGLGAYYRPITFTLYKLLITLQPPGSTLASHVVLLVVHTSNAILTGCLTRRLLCPKSQGAQWARPILGMAAYDAAGLAAAFLLACYPFAALPVAHAAAIMHPLVTLFVLGTVLATLSYVRAGRPRWLVVAIGLAALAPYTHESGIMAGAVALVVSALDDWPSTWRARRSLWVLPVASALFLPIWLLVPKMSSSFEWLGFKNLLASVTFFTQGPAFPLQPVSRLLINWLPQLSPSPLLSFVGLPWWVIAAMWGVALIYAAIASVVLLPERRWQILGVAMGWTLLLTLPSILMLPFPYITVSQRLLYSSAPGAAILSAAVCVSLACRMRRPALQGVVALVSVASIGIVPVLYVQREMALHEFAFQPLERLVGIAHSYPAEQHLVMNAVNWVNHRQPWYALGQEGISVSAPYMELDTLVGLNARTPAQFSAASFPPIWTDLSVHSYSTIGETEPWDWADVATLSPQYDHVWITNYSDQAITVEEAGSVRQGTALPPVDYLAKLGDGVFLTNAAAHVGDSTVTVELDWKVLNSVADATIFRHVYDCNGYMLAQGDGLALGRTLRLDLLYPGSEVHDIRSIPVSELPQERCLVLGVGLYLPDGTRVPGQRTDGLALENDEFLLRVGEDSGQ